LEVSYFMLSHSAANSLRQHRPELAGRLFDACHSDDLFCPGRIARLSARLHTDPLDRALADGADPAQTPRLSARAAYLTSSRTRSERAGIVERFVTCAEKPGPVRRSRVPVRRVAVRANRDQLLGLAATLRSPMPVYARGMAELELMLRDGAGPLYLDRHGEALARMIELVRAGLRG
jgi:hypothetical protein